MTDRSPDTQEASLPLDETIDKSRRKLTGAALGVSAVFTLASRPVLAGTMGQCMSPSGFQSGNLSHHGTPPTCLGRTPGYWKNVTQHTWPAGYSAGSCSNQCNKVKNWSGGTLFHPLFSGTQFMADLDNNSSTVKTSLSMMQVLQMNDGSNPWGLTDPDNLGAHIVAALLNYAAGWSPFLPDTTVINMWNEWVSKGYFEPTANVKWSSKVIVDYLKTTMPL